MTPQNKLTADLNLLSDYLARRDIPDLTLQTLRAHEIKAFDLAILFGGAIPAAADVLGRLWQDGHVKKIMVAGGIGHTTDHLKEAFHLSKDNQGLSEATLFANYLMKHYQIPETDLLLETNSTNCGENVQFTLDLLRASGGSPKETLIMQDASMQRRISATFDKIWPKDLTKIIHYAPYQPQFSLLREELVLGPTIWGIWEPMRYIELLLGEIPRLRNDATGYGPKGKNFIAPVTVPEPVVSAFERVSAQFPSLVRLPYKA